MNITAINPMTSLHFQGKTKQNKKPEHNHEQSTNVISKNGSKAMRAAILIPVATVAGLGGLTSCEPLVSSKSGALTGAWAWAIGHGNTTVVRDTTVIHDTITKKDTVINTIIKPIYLNGFPEAMLDSIKEQGYNIGIPSEGEGVYIGSKAHNRYDNKFYETKVDSTGTNNHQLATVTKIVDMYSAGNPKTTWQRSVWKDVPGKGIRIDRYVANGTKEPEAWEYNYAGYEIRSNGKNGRKNTKYIFDNNNNLIWKGDYIRGEDAGTFMIGSVVYDKDGNPCYDKNGNLEMNHHDFDKAKMYLAPIRPNTNISDSDDKSFLSSADLKVDHDINEVVIDALDKAYGKLEDEEEYLA